MPTGGNQGEASVACRACAPELAALVAPRAAVALRNLDLGREFSTVVICADDLPDGDEGWLRLDPGPPAAPPVLTLFCGVAAFADRPAVGDAFDPEPEVWERVAAPRVAAPFEPRSFSVAAADAFLHHQLFLARDLLRGRLYPASVPAGQAQAFAAAWDVIIDGVLEREGLPGYGLTVRRNRFSRLFSAAGVLMPGHWQIFQSLWDGGLEGQKEVLAALRQLPRL